MEAPQEGCSKKEVPKTEVLNDIPEFCEEAQKVFSIDLTAQKILDYIQDLSDLKSFRLISPKCNELALPRIMPRAFISNQNLEKVASERASKPSLPIESDRVGPFASLINCIRDSDNFPCVSILFSDFWHGDLYSSHRFFAYYGDFIQRLTLAVKSDVQYCSLRMLLLSWLPSLSILTIESTIFRNDLASEPRCLPESAQIENLRVLIVKTLMTPTNVIAIEDIILASPNLEILRGFDVELLNAVVRSEKTHLIELCRFVPKSSNLALFRKFAKTKPKLLTLYIPICIVPSDATNLLEDSGNVLSDILESSKDSLENLCLSIGAYSNVRLPILSNVTEIRFRALLNMRYWLEDPSEMAQKLPALKTVHVDDTIPDGLLSQAEIQKIFLEVFPSVKELVIKVEKLSKHLMEALSLKFRNVETVRINWGILKRGTEFFWILPKGVKRVEIWEFSLQKYRDLLFESFLTGIPRKVCKLLRNVRKPSVDLEIVAKLSSLLGLESLESLKFYCSDFPRSFEEDKFRYFSNLTKWFVLEDKPNLQLHLAFPQHLFFGSNLAGKTLKDFPEFDPISKDISISYWDNSGFNDVL